MLSASSSSFEPGSKSMNLYRFTNADRPLAVSELKIIIEIEHNNKYNKN